MSFFFEPTGQSGGFTTDPPSQTLEYRATGTTDQNYVWAYALGGTPGYISTPGGILTRQDIQVEPDGWQRYLVRVPYGQRKSEVGGYTVNFNTSGATVKIKAAREHIGSFPAAGETATDFGGAIGVKRGSEWEVEGCDIVVPALKLDVSFKHPQGIITIAQIKNLARATGTTNSVPFLTFAAGELLFLGCSGTEGTNVETEISYQFAASENTTDLTMGDIASIVKEGHHYAWCEFKDAVDSGRPTVKPRCVYVERVYNSLPWPLIFGWGG